VASKQAQGMSSLISRQLNRGRDEHGQGVERSEKEWDVRAGISIQIHALKNGYAGSDLGSMDRKLSHTFSRVNLRWSTGRGKVSTTVPDFTRNPNGDIEYIKRCVA
jgi:hypothetical protein